MKWETERIESNSFRASIKVDKRNDWEAWAFLSSDRHWDNPKSDLKLQKEHLDKCKERGAIVVDAGDLFCAMQGKFDKRANKSSLRPEHQGDNYFDSIVETAADFFKPYQKNLFVIGQGNHETAVKNRHEIDLTERFVSLLNQGSKHKVYNGHYGGYVCFSFKYGNNHKGEYQNDRIVSTIRLKYVHGWGGGGIITQDMIQASRRSMMYPDADIVLCGHTHDSWVMDRQVERISASGKIYLSSQTHIKTPTYKEEYSTGKGGWHVERGGPPKPIGGYFLRFFFSHKKNGVDFEVIRAK